MTLKFTLTITQNLSQAFFEVSTAQDAKGDRTQLLLRHPRVAVGAALEQQQRQPRRNFPKFLSHFCKQILIRNHLIKISTSRFKLFKIDFHLK